ncbi:MAG: substrate-binding and VWA domain-containing protein [Candidatus Nanopelagicales bacterium]|nr:substrate-binding and VWA domain-containing protein [Candidatus Nanopelagicales bacterium]
MAARRGSIIPLVIAGLLGLVLILLVRQWVGGDEDGSAQAGGEPDGSTTTAEAPEGCSTLSIVASSEKAALLATLAERYNASNSQVDGACMWMTVSTKASGAATTALARGWDETVDGPRPDVWSPASSSWAVLVDQGSTDLDRPSPMPKERPSLVQTPLVIAMPLPMAQALGWPDAQIGWKDLAEVAKSPQGWASKDHPEWGRFKLGKTNPYFSTSGLNATIASYFAATGVSSDLTSDQVADPETREFVAQLESSVVHYGDTTLTFLENMSREAAAGQGLTYVSAVTVEEKSVLDYNLGNPTGDPGTLGQQPPPSVPLAAVYPSDGTLLSDNPWITLDAEWVDDTKRESAAAFLAWLHRPEQQKVFTDAGFRTFEGEPGAPITQANGMLPAGPANILAPPSPAVLADVQESWDDLRKRAHVLFVMDVSGSMGEMVTSAGQTKLQLAQDAAIAALNGFATDDEVGLWQFSTERGPNLEPWLQLQPIGPAGTTVPAMQSDVASMVPDGGTALYATLREAQARMLADLDTKRINAIVLLSDGVNEYPPDNNLDSLLEQLEGESVDTSVRVFPIGYGEGADPVSLGAIAEASRGQYYEANDPASIEKVLASVLSNF